MPRRTWGRDLPLVCLTALLLILAFPKFDFGLLAWIALVPLLLALEGKGLRETFLLSYLAGLLSFSGLFAWIWSVEGFTVLDFVILALYLPQYVTLWAIGVRWLRTTGFSSALVAPALWVTLEYIRAHFFFLSCPCMLLGHSQYLHHSLVQITALTGTYGLSFLIVLVNVTMAETVLAAPPVSHKVLRVGQSRGFPVRAMATCLALLLGTAGYGVLALREEPASQQIKVALIQGNTSQHEHWDPRYRDAIIAKYVRLTREALREEPSLVVWPESAVPGDVLHNEELQSRIAQVAKDAKTYLLVGSAEEGKFESQRLLGKYYNNLVLFSPEGRIEGYYRKIGLVPFGEYAPLKELIQWPDFITARMGHLLPGSDFTVFRVGNAPFSGTICWEVMFPDLFRTFVAQGAGFMVNATNEVWFGTTALTHQYLAMTAMQAAQNRVAVARVGNTGVTAFIDPFGRITSRLTTPQGEQLFIEGYLIGKVPVSVGGTFYTHYGDLFALLQSLICGILIIIAALRSTLADAAFETITWKEERT